jgi:hypothetical protein
MDLSFIKKTDAELQELIGEDSPSSKEVKREIRRRRMVGYWDGTLRIVIDDKQLMDFDDEPEQEEQAVVEVPTISE